MSPDTEDDRFIAGFLAGDSSAFDRLVRKHAAWATRFAVRLLRDRDAAEDVVQESFLRVYRSLANYRGTAAFRTYLYRVVLNAARDSASRSIRDEGFLESMRERARASEPTRFEEPGADVEGDELGGRVAALVARLPRAQRETLTLRVHEGLAYRDIAEVLGVSVNAVKGNLAAARSRLAQWLGITPGNRVADKELDR